MSLRRRPAVTQRMIMANRANAQKSTGPRTPQGKARAALSALQHGRYAVRLGEKLARAGDPRESRYRWFKAEIAGTFGSGDSIDERQADQMAAMAWCVAQQLSGLRSRAGMFLKTKPRILPAPFLFPIRIVDRWRRLALVFWRQRHRYWTLERRLRVLSGEEPFALLPPHQALEPRWRRRRFRLPPPSLWEQMELEKAARGISNRREPVP